VRAYWGNVSGKKGLEQGKVGMQFGGGKAKNGGQGAVRVLTGRGKPREMGRIKKSNKSYCFGKKRGKGGQGWNGKEKQITSKVVLHKVINGKSWGKMPDGIKPTRNFNFFSREIGGCTEGKDLSFLFRIF